MHANPDILRKQLTPVIKRWRDDFVPIIVTDRHLNELISRLGFIDAPWTAKEAKKAAQKYSRRAEEAIGGYKVELAKKLALINVAMRARPKWIPRGAWRWMANRFVDVNKLQATLLSTPPH